MIDWLFANALVALALAAIAGTFIWTFRPAPAVRHALWLVVLLKLVSPSGPVVSLPIAVPPAPQEVVAIATPAPPEDLVVEAEVFTIQVQTKPGQTVEEAAALVVRASNRADEAQAEPAVAPPPAAEPPARPFDNRPFLLTAWLAGALFVGWRQLRETMRFARFVRNARPAPGHLVAEVALVAHRLGVRVPTVRVLAGLTSPVLWCLGRPVLLWPAGLECRLKGDGRRAVIAHELAHLRRRDHWVRRLEMVAAVLHWWNPLFWIARRKMRADAELACDAWATGQADRRAYAEALLEVCSYNPCRRPAPAVGVFGEGRRAMQERLTMIMRDRVPCRLAFGAKLVVALMALAAIPAWTLGQGKPEVGVEDVFLVEIAEEKDGQDAQVKELEAQIKALAQKLEAVKAAKQAEAQKSAVERLKAAQGQLGEKVKELRLSRVHPELFNPTVSGQGGIRVLIAGQDGVQVIGPDGKEIKDVKVLIGGATAEPKRVELRTADSKPAIVPPGQAMPAPAPVAAHFYTELRTARAVAGQHSSNSITLSRATYKLGKEQAAALGILLGSIKATVMETKVDGDAITVTTTPEAQAAIGQIVHLILGQGGNVRYEWNFTPSAAGTGVRLEVPATPAVPATPPTPAKPAAPAKPSASTPLGERVNVNVILEKALKEVGSKVEAIDRAALEQLLKSLKGDDKGIELKLELDTLKTLPKPASPKKPDPPK